MRRNRQLAEQFQLPRVCEALEKMRVSGGFNAFWFDDLINLVVAICIDDDELSDLDAFGICREAAHAAAKSTVTEASLTTEIGKAIQTFKKQSPKKYVVLTSISVEHNTDLVNMQIGDVGLEFVDRRPSRFDRSYVPVKLPKIEARYCSVLARVSGRSSSRAYEKGMAALGFVRGVWNFAINSGVWDQDGYDFADPLNVILPGSVHSLHNEDGTKATGLYGFEPCPVQKEPLKATDSNWKKAHRIGSQILKVVHEGNYEEALRSIFARYCSALDSRDPIRAFLQLWSILETTTGLDPQKAEYSKMIDRLSYLYADPEHYRNALRLLRERRNQATHFGVVNEYKPRADLVRLHSIASPCLRFVVEGGKFFRDLQEVGSFLSLPSNKGALERRAELTEEALRFKRHRPEVAATPAETPGPAAAPAGAAKATPPTPPSPGATGSTPGSAP